MARIAGVNIPTQKRVEVALQYIHGIGKAHAKVCYGSPALRGRTSAILSSRLRCSSSLVRVSTWPSRAR